MSSGADSAETAVGRAVNANSKGGIITSTNNRVSYQSYVIAGNAVILCQDLINNCQDLADRLEWKPIKENGYHFLQLQLVFFLQS